MKLIWTLRRDSDGFDEATDMVVVAATSEDARKVAATRCGDEGPDVWLNGRRSGKPFARIKCIGVAYRNDNGSTKKDQVVVRDGTFT